MLCAGACRESGTEEPLIAPFPRATNFPNLPQQTGKYLDTKKPDSRPKEQPHFGLSKLDSLFRIVKAPKGSLGW